MPSSIDARKLLLAFGSSLVDSLVSELVDLFWPPGLRRNFRRVLPRGDVVRSLSGIVGSLIRYTWGSICLCVSIHFHVCS